MPDASARVDVSAGQPGIVELSGSFAFNENPTPINGKHLPEAISSISGVGIIIVV